MPIPIPNRESSFPLPSGRPTIGPSLELQGRAKELASGMFKDNYGLPKMTTSTSPPLPIQPKPIEQISMGQLSSTPDYVTKFLIDLVRKTLGLTDQGSPQFQIPSQTQPYLVGENGPEMFTPEQPGQITPIPRQFGTPEGEIDTPQGPRTVNELGTPLPLRWPVDQPGYKPPIINRMASGVSDWGERSRTSLSDPVGWLKEQVGQFGEGWNLPELPSPSRPISGMPYGESPAMEEYKKSVLAPKRGIFEDIARPSSGLLPTGLSPEWTGPKPWRTKPSLSITDPASIAAKTTPGPVTSAFPNIPMPPRLNIPTRGPSPTVPTAPTYHTSPEVMEKINAIYENLMKPRGPVYGYLGPTRGWGMVSGAEYGPKQLATQERFADMLERLATDPAAFEKGIYGTQADIYGHKLAADTASYQAALKAAEMPTEDYYRRALGTHALAEMERPTTVPGGYYLPRKGFIPSEKQGIEAQQRLFQNIEDRSWTTDLMGNRIFDEEGFHDRIRNAVRYGMLPKEWESMIPKPRMKESDLRLDLKAHGMSDKDINDYIKRAKEAGKL